MRTDRELLEAINEKADLIMAAQDDIDAAVTAINNLLTDLSDDVTAIKAELASGGGGTTVDTSALNTAVGQIPAAQAALDALANPAPAAPPVTS